MADKMDLRGGLNREIKAAPSNHPWRRLNSKQWFVNQQHSEEKRQKRIKEIAHERIKRH